MPNVIMVFQVVKPTTFLSLSKTKVTMLSM